MKLCIFGADGRTGVEVVNYALECGFQVVAFVYNKESNHFFNDTVVIKNGNVMDYDAVREAMKGVDAVISVLGHIKGSDPLMQTKGITNIVKAMEELHIKRILSLTGTGARVENDTPSLIDRILNFFVAHIDPDRIRDGVEHINVLKNSALDWTVVRVLKLGKNTADVKEYTLTSGGPAELQTSRKKVAKVLVDLVADTRYIGMLPVISG